MLVLYFNKSPTAYNPYNKVCAAVYFHMAVKNKTVYFLNDQIFLM